MADHIIPSNVLDEIIRRQQNQLRQFLKLRGEYHNPVTDLCQEVDIDKQTLAIAIIFKHKGDISLTELAKKLHINPATLRKRNWHEVRKFLLPKN